MNYSHRCPKGNRQMRRGLNQAANAAVKDASVVPADLGGSADRLGMAVSVEAAKIRARNMIRERRDDFRP